MKFIKQILKNKKGQAVFELVLFLPFMLLVYTIVITICNAISGSINQQKAARGYFFARVKNNSNAPLVDTLERLEGVKAAGMNTIAWRETYAQGGQQPAAPCYKVNSFFAPTANDTCLTRPSGNSTSQFIRVKTAFGTCGTTYNIRNPDQFYRSPRQASYESCTLSERELDELPPL